MACICRSGTREGWHERNRKNEKNSLTTKIFIALLLGAAAGALLHGFADGSAFVQDVLVGGIFLVVGRGFIRLMQMLVVPLVFCSLICGAAAIGDTKTLGKVGVKAIGFTRSQPCWRSRFRWACLAAQSAWGLDMSRVQAVDTTVTESAGFAETLLDIIPKNPIEALAAGNMLQIIVFALIIGIILARLQDKVQLVTNFFSRATTS